MNPLSSRFIELLLSATASLLLAAFVWWRYRHQRLLRLFALSVLGWAGYTVFLVGLAYFDDETAAVAWIRSSSALPYFAMLSCYAFSVVLARAEGSPRVRFVGRLCLLAAAGDVLARLSGLAPLHLIHQSGQGWFPGPDPVYTFCYLPVLLATLGGGLGLIWRRRRHAGSRLERTQLTYVFLALGVGVLLSLGNLHPAFTAVAAFGPVAYNSIIAYAITRHRLLDIRVLLRQGAVVAGLSLGLGFLAAVSLLVSQAAWGTGSGAEIYSVVVAALLFTLGFDPLRRLVREAVDRLLGLHPFEPGSKLLEFSLLFTVHPRLEPFLQATADKLAAESGLEHCAFLLSDRRGHLVPAGQSQADLPPHGEGLESSSDLAKRLTDAPLGIELDGLAWTQVYEKGRSLYGEEEDLADAQARAFLVLNHAQAAFALRESGRLLGVMLVGAPRSGQVLSTEELRFFGALAQQVAQVVANVQLQAQMEQAERLSSLGTLTASLTHEIRNPLSSIGVFLQMLPTRHEDKAFIERFTRVVGQELQKLSSLSEQVLDFSKPAKPTQKSVDLAALVERVRQLMAYQFARRKVLLKLDVAPGLFADGVEAELSQVLVNLLLNALDVSGEGQAVSLSLSARDGLACLRVSDQGPGIHPKDQALLFEPFFTTKEMGTGLGLATCQRIVQSGGGSIQVESRLGHGASFEVQLPLLTIATASPTSGATL